MQKLYVFFHQFGKKSRCISCRIYCEISGNCLGLGKLIQEQMSLWLWHPGIISARARQPLKIKRLLIACTISGVCTKHKAKLITSGDWCWAKGALFYLMEAQKLLGVNKIIKELIWHFENSDIKRRCVLGCSCKKLSFKGVTKDMKIISKC